MPRYKVLKEVNANHTVVFLRALLSQPHFADIVTELVNTDNHEIRILREKVPVRVKLNPELRGVRFLDVAVHDDNGI